MLFVFVNSMKLNAPQQRYTGGVFCAVRCCRVQLSSQRWACLSSIFLLRLVPLVRRVKQTRVGVSCLCLGCWMLYLLDQGYVRARLRAI